MDIEKTDFANEFEAKESKKFLILGRIQVLEQAIETLKQSTQVSPDPQVDKMIERKRLEIENLKKSIEKYDADWLADLPSLNNYIT